MQNTILRTILTTASLLLFVHANAISAHDSGVVPIDSAGNNPSATDLASVYCYDDGNGPADHLLVQVQDFSPPVPGLLVSVQISKDNKMTNITDTISADDQPSKGTSLQGGNGSYYISVNKTNAGVRNFNVTYHCVTSGEAHTGTDISVYQVQ